MYINFNKSFQILYTILFFITPFVMFHKTSELFEFNKILFIYFLTGVIFSLWVLKMVVNKKIIIKRTSFDIIFLLFLLSCILSTVFSIDQHVSFFGYYGRFNGGLLSIIVYITLFYAFVSNIDKEETINVIKKISLASVISSFFVILWGLPGRIGRDLSCLLFTGEWSNACWTDQFRPHERMFSTLGQPNWLGAYLAISLFFGLYFLVKERKNKLISLLLYGYLIVNFCSILFTRSRSSLFAVVVCLFIFYLFILIEKRKNFFKLNKVFITLPVILFLCIIIFKTGISSIDRVIRPFSTNQTQIQKDNNKSADQANPNNQSQDSPELVTESSDLRRIVWKGAISLGLKYPILGTGLETFGYAYYFVRPISHNITSEWDYLYNKAHNEYLNYLATSGFIGIFAYLAFIISVIIYFYINIKGKKYTHINLYLFLAWVSILITNFFGFSTTVIQLYFYCIPAFLILINTKTYLNKYESEIKFSHTILPIIIVSSTLLFTLSYLLADINYANGINYLRAGEFGVSRDYLTKALLYKEEHVYEDRLSQADSQLAVVLALDSQQKDQKVDNGVIQQLIDESKQFNDKTIQQSSSNILYLKTKAKNYFIYYQMDKQEDTFNQALKALDTASKLAPTDPQSHYIKAYFYYTRLENEPNNSNLKDKMSKSLDKALQLKPNYDDALNLQSQIIK